MSFVHVTDSDAQVEDGRVRIVEMNITTGEVTVRNPEADLREPPKPFTFDQVSTGI
jgi:hypothetical protein